MLNDAKVATYKAMETERFANSTLAVIAVKSAPWSEGDRLFGTVKPSECSSGSFDVVLDDGSRRRYETLDAMLDEWVGD